MDDNFKRRVVSILYREKAEDIVAAVHEFCEWSGVNCEDCPLRCSVHCGNLLEAVYELELAFGFRGRYHFEKEGLNNGEAER